MEWKIIKAKSAIDIDVSSPCLLIRYVFRIHFHGFAEFRINHTIPVIEIRVTSARDYRAGRPTHDVLSEARRRCPFHLENTQQREGLTIFPFRCVHARGRYGVAAGASVVVGVPGWRASC